MKVCNTCAQLLPLTSFCVRRASKDGLSYKCRNCDRAYRKSRGTNHYKKLKGDWHIKNAESERLKALDNYRKNRLHRLAQHRQYMRATSEQQRLYRQENRHIYTAQCRKYRAALIKRLPMWVLPQELRQIVAVYKEAARLQRLTGVRFHVDHIYPLQGGKVSGLHVLGNLQILTASQNVSKGNRYEP